MISAAMSNAYSCANRLESARAVTAENPGREVCVKMRTPSLPSKEHLLSSPEPWLNRFANMILVFHRRKQRWNGHLMNINGSGRLGYCTDLRGACKSQT